MGKETCKDGRLFVCHMLCGLLVDLETLSLEARRHYSTIPYKVIASITSLFSFQGTGMNHSVMFWKFSSKYYSHMVCALCTSECMCTYVCGRESVDAEKTWQNLNPQLSDKLFIAYNTCPPVVSMHNSPKSCSFLSHRAAILAFCSLFLLIPREIYFKWNSAFELGDVFYLHLFTQCSIHHWIPLKMSFSLAHLAAWIG